MEESKSNANTTTTTDDDDDDFFDAPDEFPFYDCSDTIEPDQSISKSQPRPSPGLLSPTGVRRRRSWSQHIRNDTSGSDSNIPNLNSSVSFNSTERKYRISRSLKENAKGNGNSDSIRESANGETKESSTITDANANVVNDPTLGRTDESPSSFLFILAGFLIKAIGFQMSLLVNFVIFPLRLLYCSYMFVMDPFQVARRGREYLTARLLRIWGVISDSVTPFVYDWLKEHKSIWKLALRFGWGFLWATYVCFVLTSVFVLAFVVSGFIVRHLVEEPIQMKERLTFDYTKNSPVAFVPIMSCPGEPRGVSNREKSEVVNFGAPRVIPLKHKLQVTISLILPESDYNRNLGIFQVRVDFLSANGKSLASSSQPCMLRFKSQPIRLLLTFLKIAPLVTGYSSESQTLNVNFRGFTEGHNPTSCLRVMIEQRAEFRPGAGSPEIYDASLTLESELPLPKRIIWHWKKTVFIWIGMTTFTMELLFMLLCCRPIIMPGGRPRDGAANNSAQQNNRPAQR